MEEINNYPALVDAIWKIVQGTPEDRERVDFTFSEQQIVASLGIRYSWEGGACAYGVPQAINDLVELGYCKGLTTYNGHRWMWISPSPHCPDVQPSALFITPPIPKLPLLRRQALQFIHEQTVRHEEGITFYDKEISMLHQEAVSILLPTTKETDMYTTRGTVIEAMLDLKNGGYVRGTIPTGALTLWITLKGACWLLVVQPLLKLSDRASQLVAHSEASEATMLLINAHSETESNAARMLHVTVEKLENGAGGEKGLVKLLGQSKAYIGDLKQSLQSHRHATTHAQSKLSHQQCLERTTEIIERYITRREQVG